VKITELRLHNFGPYKGDHALQFSTDLARTIVLVFGDNMRGKTSLLNALRWVLYGRALDRRSQTMDMLRLLNTDAQAEGDWGMSASLSFEHDGSGYELRRFAAKRAAIATPRNSGDFEIGVSLRRDGAVMSQDAIDHHLNQIMPMQISRFHLFDGELLQEYEALLVDEDDQGEKIKSAIEHVLGVPALINARAHLRTLLKEAQSKQAKELKHSSALKSYGEQMERLQAEIQSHEDDLRRLRTGVAATTTEIEDLEKALSATEAVERDKGALDGFKQTQKRLNEEQQQVLSARVELMRTAWKDLLQPRLSAHIAALEEAKAKHESTIERKGELRSRALQLADLLKYNECPLCKHDISTEKRDAFGAQRGDIEGELQVIATQIGEVAAISAELQRFAQLRPTGATVGIASNDRQLANIAVQLTKVESEIERIEERIAGFDTAEIAAKRTKWRRLLEHRGKLNGDVASRESEQKKKQRDLDGLSRLAAEKSGDSAQRSTREVEIYQTLEAVFSISVDKLRDDLRREVEREATAVFKELTTEKSYRGLRINKNYGLTIVDGAGRDVNVRSAGAEQVVALALIAALNRTANKPAPVIMDTPLGRLDPKHRKNILSFVSGMAEQIVLLVHEGELDPARDLGELRDRVSSEYEIERISSARSALRRRSG
jgi:DNA sulfur modification protein DndD